MKSHLILLALLLLGFACGAQNQIDKQGRKQGHWIKNDKNGAKIFEGEFKDGHEVGTFQYFYPDGTLRIKNTFEGSDGKRCAHEAYDEKGRLVAKGFYNMKNRDGEWKFYAEDGALIKIANYRMGIKEGMHAVLSHNGDTAEVVNWKNNKKDGRWWKRIGEKGYITCTYVNGSFNGKLTEYNSSNQLVHECTYTDGNRDGHSIYYNNGLKTIDETWTRGIFVDRKILIREGQKAHYMSVYDIAYLVPTAQGNKVIVYPIEGEKITATESSEDIYGRLGDEFFSLVSKKNRVMVATRCIKGLTKDSEGRDILDLSPKPSFVIFPDEDCIKLVNARMNEINGVMPGEK